MDNYTFTRLCFVIYSHLDTWILCFMIETHMLQDNINCAFPAYNVNSILTPQELSLNLNIC